MGQRQEFLKKIIAREFHLLKHPKLKPLEIENSEIKDEIYNIYLQLKGIKEIPPIKFGSWDICTENFIIELDEERHFNRYRNITLNSSLYKKYLTNFDINNYKNYCSKFENNCLKTAGWGGNWKNNSTEKMFIKSDISKNLELNGSSRWRQRAYYDFLKDITSIIHKIPIIRISIYDEFEQTSINQILNTKNKLFAQKLLETKINKYCR